MYISPHANNYVQNAIMELKVFADYTSLSETIARDIISLVQQKPDAVLCLATGDTPKLTYSILTARAAKEKIDFSACKFIGLDEWMGIPSFLEGSCSQFLHQYIFKPLRISPAHIHLFNGLVTDAKQECEQMDAFINAGGGIDLMIAGVGINGHIGFNEPGVALDNYSHVIDLDASTIESGYTYFTQPVNLSQGITLGMQHVMASKSLIAMANGQKKSQIIKAAIEEEPGNHLPVTVLRSHPGCKMMVDAEAAALINKAGIS